MLQRLLTMFTYSPETARKSARTFRIRDNKKFYLYMKKQIRKSSANIGKMSCRISKFDMGVFPNFKGNESFDLAKQYLESEGYKIIIEGQDNYINISWDEK